MRRSGNNGFRSAWAIAVATAVLALVCVAWPTPAAAQTAAACTQILTIDDTTNTPTRAFRTPLAVFRDAVGNLFVADSLAQTVYKFDASGTQLLRIDNFTTGAPTATFPGFGGPQDVFVDAAGKIYIADGGFAGVGNGKVVHVFDGVGGHLFSIGNDSAVPPNPAFGLRGPMGVAVDGAGNIWVVEPESQQLYGFDPTGVQFIAFRAGSTPQDVTVDAAGNVYVVDGGFLGTGDRITGYDPTLVGFLSIDASNLGLADWNPRSVSADAAGNLFVSDAAGLVYGFRPDGTLFLTFDPSATAEVLWGIAAGVAGDLFVSASPSFSGGLTYVRGYTCRSGTVAVPGGVATVSTSDGFLTDLTNSVVPAIPAPPAGVTFPHDLIGFRVVGIAPGATVTVTVTLPGPVTEFWKLQNGAWHQVVGAAFVGNDVVLTLVDGGPDDADGIANGVIVDPGGPATASAPPATATPVPTAVPTATPRPSPDSPPTAPPTVGPAPSGGTPPTPMADPPDDPGPFVNAPSSDSGPYGFAGPSDPIVPVAAVPTAPLQIVEQPSAPDPTGPGLAQTGTEANRLRELALVLIAVGAASNAAAVRIRRGGEPD